MVKCAEKVRSKCLSVQIFEKLKEGSPQHAPKETLINET
jgi:hypothetical protein